MQATETEIKLAHMLVNYRQDPVGFCKNILSLNPDWIWDKMVEMMEAIRDHQKVAIRAGHSVSKTFTIGRIAVWFKMCYNPSTVVTTAPSKNQVQEQLWREIHAAHASSKIPLGGELTTLKWNLVPAKDVLEGIEPHLREQWEKNFAIGFSTRAEKLSDNVTTMQGWHNKWLLALLDEACGIHPKIWKTAVESLITNERCKIAAIGNPTDPESDFAQACYSSDPDLNNGDVAYMSDEGWYVITIDAMKNPNYLAGKEIIEGLASKEWADDIIKKHGIGSDRVRYRIKGLFPLYKEGTFYGAKLAAAANEKRIGKDFNWDDTQPVWTFTDTGDKWTATIFAQFLGDRIRIIDDYWDNEGQGVANWANVLGSKPYVYGKEHYVGPELAAGTSGRFQTGQATTDLSAELGYNMTPVDNHTFNNGIEAVRSIWQKIDIYKPKCSTFLKAAKGYGKEKNEARSTDDEPVYQKAVAQTWHRHMMDALRHLAMQYRYGRIGNKMIGYPRPIPASAGMENPRDAGVSDDNLLRT